MTKHKAIPQGYMTVGQLAKKMGTTVRTLQYYDKEGLLAPSSESDGGRRLYTDKDMIKLHQILSLKSLGFSLEDIRKRLIPLDSPSDVADALAKQADAVNRQIESLSATLSELEALRKEVLQMKNVDFKKYADIIVNLQMKNEHYYLIKRFDDKMLDHIRSSFDKESGLAFMEKFNHLSNEILKLKENSVPVESEQCQQLTKKYWDMIMEFTGGDMNILTKLVEMASFDGTKNEWEKKQEIVNAYIEPALSIYFSKSGINPFEENNNE